MTDQSRRRATCPHCGRNFTYMQYHAGFSNEGYMYCDTDETVLTWDAYDPQYAALTTKLPWTLDAAERRRVEAAVKPCPFGGDFGFANPPLCPFCHESIAFLVPSREYYIITGRHLASGVDDVWKGVDIDAEGTPRR